MIMFIEFDSHQLYWEFVVLLFAMNVLSMICVIKEKYPMKLLRNPIENVTMGI